MDNMNFIPEMCTAPGKQQSIGIPRDNKNSSIHGPYRHPQWEPTDGEIDMNSMIIPVGDKRE